MRKIDRVAELDFWEEYKKRHPGIRYGDLRSTAAWVFKLSQSGL